MQQNENSFSASPVRVLSIIFAIAIQNCQHATAEDSNIFLYNTIDQCKKTEHFDVNYFKCKSCDAALMLEPAENSKKKEFLRLQNCFRLKKRQLSVCYPCTIFRTLMPL